LVGGLSLTLGLLGLGGESPGLAGPRGPELAGEWGPGWARDAERLHWLAGRLEPLALRGWGGLALAWAGRVAPGLDWVW